MISVYLLLDLRNPYPELAYNTQIYTVNFIIMGAWIFESDRIYLQ